MSTEGAQSVFGTAIISSDFRQALLDCPAEAIQGFDLTSEEFEALARIRANSLHQFAAKFERWRLSKSIGRERSLPSYSRDAYACERKAG